MIAALVINFNTADRTVGCIRSLRQARIAQVWVLDNASRPDDVAKLREEISHFPAGVVLVESPQNLGFARGSNLLIERALADTDVQHVFLLNSDAVLVADGAAGLWQALDDAPADMIGGRVHKRGGVAGSDSVESLGIAIYRPLLASNRKSLDENHLGPTGGCAIYSRRLLEDLRVRHGYVFDPDYFCYAEDTDLCIRARLLGYSAQYVDEVVAIHEGQASSGGGFNDFVLYHGIRNSIWTLVKSVPATVILRNLPWIVLLHLGIVVRHGLRNKSGVVWRLYRDALLGLPAMLRKRRIIQMSRQISGREFQEFITSRFYERSYLVAAVRELLPKCFRAH